ncbi:MAG: serine/threonine protein kinase [Proteobacteria bacterium]|nr:MAG: serine/threonine protein kinase [Pseudomonadota bacterium]
MSFSPEYFGRYLLLEPLVETWNTALFHAKLFGSDGGPDRVVTLKKVVAEISGEDLQKSFEQEIKITVGLNHPNVVQTYDFGVVDGRYFMAMEYLPGQSLSALARRLAELDLMCSAELSCHIVSQVCHALNYAHNFRDRVSGEPRAVVHRDVSPEKIILTYDGAVKLVEFGMARMESHEHFTRVGIIAGQPGYMSPERLFGEELDGRADIYSLGVVLWEMLTGMSFRNAGKNLEEVRARLAEPAKPPSAHNPAVPKRLDSIVMRAMAIKPTDRYGAVADFQRDLHQFLYSHAPEFNPQDLTAHVQELFRAEVDAEEAKLRAYLQMPAPAAAKPEQKELTLAAVDYAHVGTRTSIERTGMMISDAAFTERELEKLFVKNVQHHQATINAPLPDLAPVEFEAVADLMVTANAEAPLRSLRMNAPPGRPERAPERSAEPARLNVSNNKPLYAAGAVLALGVSLAFFFATDIGAGFRKRATASVAGVSILPRKEVAEATKGRMPAFASGSLQGEDPLAGMALEPGYGAVLFNGDTFGFDLELNGNFKPVVNNRIAVPLGVPFRLRARKAGFEDFEFEGRVAAADAPLSITLKFPPVRPKGYLSVVAATEMKLKVFEGDTLVFEGKTPLPETELAAGTYRLVMENPFLGTPAEEEIRIEQGKRTSITH